MEKTSLSKSHFEFPQCPKYCFNMQFKWLNLCKHNFLITLEHSTKLLNALWSLLFWGKFPLPLPWGVNCTTPITTSDVKFLPPGTQEIAIKCPVYTRGSRFSCEQLDVSFSYICPVIDHELRHNIVKVAVDPRGDSWVGPQTTFTMLGWNSWSITGQTHEKLTSTCFLTLTNCHIIFACSRSLPHPINYKFMCLSAYFPWELANERRRISAVIVKSLFNGYVEVTLTCYFVY